MERAIQQTFHHKLQLRYRGLPLGKKKTANIIKHRDSLSSNSQLSWTRSFVSIKKEPMEGLFQFRCQLTVDRPVNCLCWHKVREFLFLELPLSS